MNPDVSVQDLTDQLNAMSLLASDAICTMQLYANRGRFDDVPQADRLKKQIGKYFEDLRRLQSALQSLGEGGTSPGT